MGYDGVVCVFFSSFHRDNHGISWDYICSISDDWRE